MNEMKPHLAEQVTCSANAELTEADVRKALECCTSEVSRDFNCDVCPYKGKGCIINLLRDALALLREKDALLAEWDAKCNDYETALMGKVAEIERLKAHNKELDNLCDILHKKLDEGYAEFANEERAEAVTEFADRLKSTLIAGGIYPVLVKNSIEKIAQEMKEGSKDA